MTSAYRNALVHKYNPALAENSSVLSAPIPEFHRNVVQGNIGLVWDLESDAILSLKDEIIAYSKQVEDQVASIPQGKHDFENTFMKLASLENDIATLCSICDFLHHVHPDSKVRDASSEADKQLAAYFVESGMREDLYQSVSQAEKEIRERGEFDKLGKEDQRLIEFVQRDYKRNGLHLDEEKRKRIKEIQQEMSELSIEFSRNLAEDKSSVLVDKSELEGMPEDYNDKLGKEQVDGSEKLVITMKYPDVFPLLKLCRNPETRKKVENVFAAMCRDKNSVILEKLVSLRHEQSQLLGFLNHASYILDIRMAKQPKAILDFLNDLMVKLDPLFQSEMKIFRSMKQEIEKVSEKDSEIKAWDYRFYMNLREEKEFMVDHELVKQYFPLQKVTEGLLEIYQHLLALKFVEVTNPKTWHPEVRLFEVYDAKNPKEFVGNFYLDLHPREGKYGHAAVFGLQPSFGFGDSSPESRKQYPVAAMVANFTKPGKEKPSLLNHQEVVTYFHEFGHVVHQICSKTKYSRFSGTRVERDFVEAPSQMLENWCWEKESLLKMSGHYQTGAPLPEHILEKLVAAKNANAGIFNFRQMFFGIFDQTIHSMSSANTEQVYNSLMHKVFQVPPSPGTNGSASFGHLAGGYDATYYGYLWSEVYSADMFDSKFRGNVLDQKSGIEYREKILLVGGTRDAIDSLKDFLGREPNSNAFMKSKGIFKE